MRRGRGLRGTAATACYPESVSDASRAAPNNTTGRGGRKTLPLPASWVYDVRIVLSFRSNSEPEPSAVTGVEGEVTDLILPAVGDVVEHRNASGTPFRGKVTERIFSYNLPNGHGVQGGISITLCMDQTTVQ